MKKIILAAALLLVFSMPLTAQDYGDDDYYYDDYYDYYGDGYYDDYYYDDYYYDDYYDYYDDYGSVDFYTDGMYSFDSYFDDPNENWDTDAGTPSFDGKYFWGSAYSYDSMRIQPWVWTRNSDGVFAEPVQLTIPADFADKDMLYPAVSKDNKTMVFIMKNSSDHAVIYSADIVKMNSLQNIQELTELGSLSSPTHPRLSGDGLTLYFVDDGQIKYAQRKSAKAKFSAAAVLTPSKGSFDEVNSIWVSADELELYYLDGSQTLYKSTRSSTKKTFDAPKMVTEEFQSIPNLELLGVNAANKEIYFYAIPDDYYTLIYKF
jgi:hypothetical protein